MKNQVEEKQRQEAAEREAQRHEDDETEAIRRYLLQVESEDALAKRKELLTLRNDWRYQAAQRDDARQQDARVRARGIDPDACAPGAAQKFDGEDVLRLERQRTQALQAKQWSQQLADERRERDADEQRDLAAYMAHVFEIERLQQTLHTASERERAHVAAEIQRCNQQLLAAKRAHEQRREEREQAQNAHEIAHSLQSNLVSENPLQAARPDVPMDQRVRVDHWKGFSGAETKRFLAQNDQLLADKAQRAEQQRAQLDDERRCHAELQRVLAQEEHETQQRRAQTERELRRDRERQAREATEREKRNADAAHGKFEPGFFQAFGRSYR